MIHKNKNHKFNKNSIIKFNIKNNLTSIAGFNKFFPSSLAISISLMNLRNVYLLIALTYFFL